MRGDINGIQGSTIHGVSLGGDKGETYHVGFDVGLSIGIGPNVRDRYELIQIPVNLHTSRWLDRTWLLAAESGVRFDFGSVNLDFTLKLGSMIGEESGFALVPTMKLGFLDDLFGIQMSKVIYSQDKSIADGFGGRSAISLDLNIFTLASLIAGTKSFSE